MAVFDFDVHHGNGTEAILLGRPGFAFFSVHHYPGYAGTGAFSFDNWRIYPVAPGSDRSVYRARLEEAFADLLAWKPDVLGISMRLRRLSRRPIERRGARGGGFSLAGFEHPRIRPASLQCAGGGL